MGTMKKNELKCSVCGGTIYVYLEGDPPHFRHKVGIFDFWKRRWMIYNAILGAPQAINLTRKEAEFYLKSFSSPAVEIRKM